MGSSEALILLFSAGLLVLSDLLSSLFFLTPSSTQLIPSTSVFSLSEGHWPVLEAIKWSFGCKHVCMELTLD